MASTVEIDLAGISSKEALLAHLGSVLELGGLEGNAGWGMNWDALKDSLCFLDRGGIHGTSKKLKFPLKLTFVNFEQFRTENPKDFSIFEEILGSVQGTYEKAGMELAYEFVDSK